MIYNLHTYYNINRSNHPVNLYIIMKTHLTQTYSNRTRYILLNIHQQTHLLNIDISLIFHLKKHRNKYLCFLAI